MEIIFEEREVEIQLKKYFQYMEKFYGEEYIYECLHISLFRLKNAQEFP